MYEEKVMTLLNTQLDNFFAKPSGSEETIETFVTVAFWSIAKLCPTQGELSDSTNELEVAVT